MSLRIEQSRAGDTIINPTVVERDLLRVVETLTQLTASDITLGAIDVTGANVAGKFTYTPGNFTGKIDGFANVAASVPASVGAWVRQKATAVSFIGALPGAVPRSAQDKARERVSIEDLGAIGDGVFDNRVIIQRAIDQMAARGGGTVEVPSGTYMVSWVVSPDGVGVIGLDLKDGVTLSGTSMHGSTLKAMPLSYGSGAFVRFIASFNKGGSGGVMGVDRVGIENLTVDGNRQAQGMFANQGNGGNIVLGPVRQCAIHRVVSKNAAGQCIQIRGTQATPAERVTITNCQASEAAGSSINSEGIVTEEYNGNGIGIQVSHGIQVTIANNIVWNTKDNCIDCYGNIGIGNDQTDGGSILIANNNVTNGRCGVFPETSGRVMVTGNFIGGMVDTGIVINRIHGAPNRTMITGNTIMDVYQGIRVIGDCSIFGVSIKDNYISDINSNNGCGILLGSDGGNCSYVSVTGNTFAIDNFNAPLVSLKGSSVVFVQIYNNEYFFSHPLPLLNQSESNFQLSIGEFISISNGSDLPDIVRQWGKFGKVEIANEAKMKLLRVSDTVSFFGSPPVGTAAAPAAATDAATTQALVNSIRGRLIDLGLWSA